MKMKQLLLVLWYCFAAFAVKGQTFTGTGGSIPDAGAQTCFPIVVSGVGIINGNYGLSSVCINVTHSFDADLEIILRAPDGTEIPLSIRNGGTGANYSNTCFTATAATPIISGSAPFTGNYLPQGYLGNVNNGQNANGVWQLCLQDVTNADAGTLDSWALNFNSTPASPPPLCTNNPPAGNTCGVATPICNFDGYCGNTSSLYNVSTWPELTAAFCGTINNNSFFKFVASANTATFNVWVTNSLSSLGIQLMIYGGGCESGAVTSYGCANQILPNSTGPTLVSASGLTPGQTYFIIVDGFNGDNCDYIIRAGTGVQILSVSPNSPSICPGSTVTLTASGGSGGYTWSPGTGLNTTSGTSVIAQPSQTTIYTLNAASTVNNCPQNTSVIVRVNQKPNIGADSTLTSCIGSTVDLTQVYNTTGLTTSWTKAGTPVANPAAVASGGIYRLIVRNATNCADTAFVTVNLVPKPALGADQNTSICSGKSINLNSLYSLTGLTGYWYSNTLLLNRPDSVTLAGLYDLIAFNGSSCSDTSQVNLVLNPKPDLGVDRSVQLCSGSSIDLNGLFDLTGLSVNWTYAGSPLADVAGVTLPGNYQLIVRNSFSCSDTVNVTVTLVSKPNLGPDRTASLCNGTPANLYLLVPADGLTANWTFGGTAVPRPDSITVAGTYQLIASENAVCRDTVQLLLIAAPKPNMGADQQDSVCSGSVVLLNTYFTTAGLSVSWVSGTTPISGSQITASSNGIYTGIGISAQGCRDTVTLTLARYPKPEVGNSLFIENCPGIAINLENLYNTSSLISSWTRYGVPVADPANVADTGLYRLIVSNSSGCKDTTFVDYRYYNKPNIGADQSLFLCPYTSISLDGLYLTSGLISNWTIGGTPVSNPGNVTIPGVYDLTVTNLQGCVDTVTVTITAAAKPNLGADKNDKFCNKSTFNLNGVFPTAGLTTNWTFSNSPVTNPAAVNLSGFYILEATNNFGCKDTAKIYLFERPKPSLGNDKAITICIGTTYNLIQLYDTSQYAFSYELGGTAVADPAAINTQGIYSVIAANGFGCTDTALVDFRYTAKLQLGNDTTITLCTPGSINLNSIYSTAGIPSSWSVGGNPVPDSSAIVAPGIYQIIAGSATCLDTAIVTVIQHPKPFIGNDQSFTTCDNEPINLASSFNLTGLFQTNWYYGNPPVGSSSPTATVNPGVYRVIGKNNFLCADTAYATLLVNPSPKLGPDKYIYICATDSIRLDTVFNVTGLTYAWTKYGNPVANILSVKDTGVYRLTAINGFNCKDTAFVFLNYKSKINLGADRSENLCPGVPINLNTAYDPSLNLSWSQGGSPVPAPTNISTAGTFQVIATSSLSCADTANVTVVLRTKPSLGPDKSSAICPGSSIGLAAQYNTTGLTSSWTIGGNPVTNPSAVSSAGAYQLIAQNTYGCEDTAIFNLNVNSKPNLGQDTKLNICPGTIVNLTTYYNTSSLTANWTLIGLPVPDPTNVVAEGSYQLIATNSSSCSDTAVVSVLFLPKPSFGPDSNFTICSGSMVNIAAAFVDTGMIVNWTYNSGPSGIPVSVGTAGIYEATGTNLFGCKDTARSVLVVNPHSYLTVYDTTCNNLLPYNWNGQQLNATGVYSTTLVNQYQCDSVITLHLQVNDTTTAILDTAVCSNQFPINLYGSTLNAPGTYQIRIPNSIGCDSVITIHLIRKLVTSSVQDSSVCPASLPFIWNGQSVTGAGTYTATLNNAAGCDSIASLNVYLLANTSSNTSISICENELPYSWNGLSCAAGGNYQVTLTNAAGCDSVANLSLTIRYNSSSSNNLTLCNNQLPYLWNGLNIPAAGTYNTTLLNQAGCDSLLTLVVVVNDTSVTQIQTAICINSFPYFWNGLQCNSAGTYTVHLLNSAGCDSMVQLQLSTLDTSFSNTSIIICENNLPYLWNGINCSNAGIYTAHFFNAAGCDSTAYLHLTVTNNTSSVTDTTLCENGLPFVWNGISVSGAGNYTALLTNANGCDSSAQLRVMVLLNSFSTTDTSVCAATVPFIWNGVSCTGAGLFQATLINAAGCDSVATIRVTLLQETSSSESVSRCANQMPYLWNGLICSAAGIYTVHRTNAAGCDSTAILNLSIIDTSFSNTQLQLCTTLIPYSWNGLSISSSGTYQVTLTNAAGCDSIANLQIEILDTTSSFVSIQVCNNQLPYNWNGQSLNSSGLYEAYFTSFLGCDSVARIQFTVTQTSSSLTDSSICINQLPISWNGLSIAAAGSYSVTLVNAAGCDSLAQLTLQVKDTTSGYRQVAVCANQTPYLWNGNAYSITGRYTAQLINAAGCDSLDVLDLLIVDTSTSTTILQECITSLPVLWNGLSLSNTGLYQVTLTNAAGCDSVARIQFTVLDTTNSWVQVQTCNNQLPYSWNGQSLSTPGLYEAHFLNAAGCDSVARIQFTVTQTSSSLTDSSICINQLPISWNGLSIAAAGSYSVTLVNAAGCDSLAQLTLQVKDTTSGYRQVAVCANQTPYLWNGNAYSITGRYTAQLINAAGCDSLDVLDLIITDTSTSLTRLAICAENYPFNWNGLSCTSSGIYQVHLVNAAGCDSLATLELSTIAVYSDTTRFVVCPTAIPVNWNGQGYSISGTYPIHLLNQNGCDSVAVLILQVNPATSSQTNLSICPSQLPYSWNGLTCNSAGTYTAMLQNIWGCDSTAVLDLIVRSNSNSITQITICETDFPFSWNGQTFATPGNYSVHLINAAGCDSLAQLQLSQNVVTRSTTQVTICPSQIPYNWNGSTYTAAGVYTVTLTNAAGCDSLATLDLHVLQNSRSNAAITVCPAALPYNWNGQTFTAGGNYTVIIPNGVGCDSVISLNLQVTDTARSFTAQTICPSALPYSWNGISCPAAGLYRVILRTSYGCDSIASLQLTVAANTQSLTRHGICPGTFPYNWNGNSYSAPGVYQVTLVNAVGCDSVASLDLYLLPVTSSSSFAAVCASQLPFNWNGQNYTAAGQYTVTLVNQYGCDSLAQLELVVNNTTASQTQVTVCRSSLPFSWNGQSFSDAGLYHVLLTNQYGCDSVAHLQLQVTDTSFGYSIYHICANQVPYLWNGLSCSSSGTYRSLQTAASGCDSVAVLVLIVEPLSETRESVIRCANELPYLWNDQTITAAGDYQAVRINQYGCDSTIYLHLQVNPIPENPLLRTDTLICPGEKLLLTPASYTSYVWSTGATSSSLMLTEPGMYWLEVTNNWGCKNRDSLSLQWLDNCDDIQFPNAFTPNNDGLNDRFGALGNLFLAADFHLAVYDRYGNRLFSTNNPYQRWDGRLSNGTPALPGTYTWAVSYRFKGLQLKNRQGTVVLIR